MSWSHRWQSTTHTTHNKQFRVHLTSTFENNYFVHDEGINAQRQTTLTCTRTGGVQKNCCWRSCKLMVVQNMALCLATPVIVETCGLEPQEPINVQMHLALATIRQASVSKLL